MNIYTVILSNRAKKDLIKLPIHVVRKLQAWVNAIEDSGLREIRKISGYHDETLKGDRAGQRSIRLSKNYRAIYKIDQMGKIEIINVLEVNKHDY